MVGYVNIICSDEALLVQEACDIILTNVRKEGVQERNIVDVVDKFSWDDLLANNSSLSLFSESKITDIRFTIPPKKEAQLALVDLLETASQDNQFLIRLPKVDKRQKTTKWFKSIVKNAKVQELWPPKPFAYLDWIKIRARKFQLDIENDAAAILAEQTEGNLLAGSQSLEKLKLLFPDDAVSVKNVKEVISDNARYSIFLCLDEAIAGNGKRAVKMLRKFKQEGIQPMMVLANISREIGYCSQVSLATFNGKNGSQALASDKMIWESKKQALVRASNRLPLVIWQKLLERCAKIDRIIKGQESGDVWLEIEDCIWLLSGKNIWGKK